MEETAGGNLVHPGLSRLTQVSAKLDQALRPLLEHGRQLLEESFSSFFFFFRALTEWYLTDHAVTRRGKAAELAELIYNSSD